MMDAPRKPFRISARARWIAAAVLFGLALTVAPPWRPAPAGQRIVLSPGALLPPIFRPVSVAAQAPVTTTCTGTPIPADPLLGGLDGELSITMNSLSLLTAANVEAQIVTSASPKKLNFAKNAGVFGTFAKDVIINNATYTQVKGVVSATLTILCAVKYDKTNKICTGGGVQTYVTKGASALTDPDGVGLPATASQITTSGGDQSFTMPLPTPVTVSTGATKEIDMYFNNNAACELWDISVLKGHAAGTDFKIVPGSQSPSQSKVP